MSDDDRAGEFGPIYLPALQRIRDRWLELEPFVEATAMEKDAVMYCGADDDFDDINVDVRRFRDEAV